MRALSILLIVFVATADAQTESEYYTISTVPVPKNIILEAGGVAALPDGAVAVGTRHGEVWIIKDSSYKKFASGLHEILGLAYKNNALFTVQRSELTKLIDLDHDGKADRYETVYRWPISGNYHEYSYGPVIAPDGSMYVTTNVAFEDYDPLRAKSWVPWRGWTLRITEKGEMEPWATGMRSPCGTGWIDSSFFYADNQGDWIGSGGLVQVNKGDFTGNPAGLRWAADPLSPVKVRQQDIYSRVDPQAVPDGGPYPSPVDKTNERGKRLFEVAKEVAGVKLPAVWLPHGVLGISLSDIFVDTTHGQFGPFAGQTFIGDMGQSKINRVFLERINGVYQGAAFDFKNGFESGVLRMSWGQHGELFVGQTNRGWGSTGKEQYGLQVLKWSGKTPFEMKAVRAMPDGFDIEFTLPVDARSAEDIASYSVMNFIYKYHAAYGGPVVDDNKCPVRMAVVSGDRMHVRLIIDSLKQYFIHELTLTGIKDINGLSLLHKTAYYTLNEIPAGNKMAMQHRHERVPPTTTRAEAIFSPKRITTIPGTWKMPDRKIILGTLPGLKFDQSKITVKTGARISLTFQNKDDMLHNFVLVMPGTASKVGERALNLGVQGSKLNYIPLTKDVLAHTKLITPNTKETIYFTAPAKPGNYPFICTFPGHYLVMRGVLEVL